ncbi:hypothetical protein SMICM17S_00295 [Streptomyces microflavus]
MRPIPLWISSTTTGQPIAALNSCISRANSSESTRMPPSPWMGSTTKAQKTGNSRSVTVTRPSATVSASRTPRSSA